MLARWRHEVERVLTGRSAPPLGFITYPVLGVFAQLWKAVSSTNQQLYLLGWRRRRALNVPLTLSVGNATLGGSGKTPMVEYLTRVALSKGYHPLVLMRGYGKDEEFALQNSIIKNTVAKLGVGANRTRIGQQILDRHPDINVVLLDDGLQHFALERNIDLLMVNVVSGCSGSFNRLVPRGALRETWTSALNRADMVVLHHANLLKEDQLDSIEAFLAREKTADPPPVFVRTGLIPKSIESIDGKFGVETLLTCGKIVAFCGIGCSQSFYLSLLQTLPVHQKERVEFIEYEDHHQFTNEDMNKLLEKRSKHENTIFITSEKDYFRNTGLLRRKLGSSGFIMKSKLCPLTKKDKELLDELISLDTTSKLAE